eukprot:9492602-Pyramimonas_sp.AAC.1
MSSQNISQMPQVHLPAGFLNVPDPGPTATLSRKAFSAREIQEFTRTAEKVAQQPWAPRGHLSTSSACWQATVLHKARATCRQSLRASTTRGFMCRCCPIASKSGTTSRRAPRR